LRAAFCSGVSFAFAALRAAFCSGVSFACNGVPFHGARPFPGEQCSYLIDLLAPTHDDPGCLFVENGSIQQVLVSLRVHVSVQALLASQHYQLHKARSLGAAGSASSVTVPLAAQRLSAESTRTQARNARAAAFRLGLTVLDSGRELTPPDLACLDYASWP
jgi:hypothetical protein